MTRSQAPAIRTDDPPAGSSCQTDKLPLAGLLTLAGAAFMTLMTEIMPAGLLSSMAKGLSISESLTGQFITAFACGALIAAIPVTALTQGVRRRPLMLAAIAGFAVVNLITALSTNYVISLMARFAAGVFGGVVWSLLAGYAVRMTPTHLGGRAIAISGAGAAVALVLGVPASTLLGRIIGWQGAFGIMSATAVLLIVCGLAVLPDFPGQKKGERPSLVTIVLTAGIGPALLVVFTFVAAHSILYVYIEPFLGSVAPSRDAGTALLIFGLGSFVSLWCVGATVDRWLRPLIAASVAIFAFAALLLGICSAMPAIIYPAVFAWGLAFGGFATLTQTILARFAGNTVDVALSMNTTVWNCAVAAAGAAGGILLDEIGPTSFPWVIIAMLAVSFGVVVLGVNKVLARDACSN
ncbi:MFS transporter [Rhizobium sp. BR 314]|uniref:MFS transporter n=1 Tax=Rhizobium sp. BR 314 TaxID=3040013 RepID=UPI0039BFA908